MTQESKYDTAYITLHVYICIIYFLFIFYLLSSDGDSGVPHPSL